MPFYKSTDPQDYANFLSLPHSSICHMPTGWDLYIALPLGKDILDELKPLELIELRNHLFRVRRELSGTSTCSCEAQSNVEDMIFCIVGRSAAMSIGQYRLWSMGVGFPVYDERDRLVEFFVDQQGLENKERERLEREKREVKRCEPVMRGGGVPEQHGDEHDSSEKDTKEKPVICDSRTLYFSNRLISYEKTFFPPCGGSFKDVYEFEEYFATLTTEEKILLGEDVLRIVDRTPSAWELLSLEEANVEIQRREPHLIHHIEDDDEEEEEKEEKEEEEEASPCSCTCNDCESCQGIDEEEDTEVDHAETEDEDAKKTHICSACEPSWNPTPGDMRRILGLTPALNDSILLTTQELSEFKRNISDMEEEVLSWERYLRCQLDLVSRWWSMFPSSKNEQVPAVTQPLPPRPTQIPIQAGSPPSQDLDLHAPPPTPQIVMRAPYGSPHPNSSLRARAPETSCLHVESHCSPRLYSHEPARIFPDMIKVAPAPEPVRSPPPYHKTPIPGEVSIWDEERRLLHLTPIPRKVSMWNEQRKPSKVLHKDCQSTKPSHYPPHPSVEDVIDSPRGVPSKPSMPPTSSWINKKAFPAGETRVPHPSEYGGTAKHVLSPHPRVTHCRPTEHDVWQSSSPHLRAQTSKPPPLSTQQYSSPPSSRFRRNVRFENERPQVHGPDEEGRKANQGVRRSTPAHLPAHDVDEKDFWEGSWRDV